jgi:hypothetical protein
MRSLAGIAAISVQDDADVARHRPLFELTKEVPLANPGKETQEQRCRGATCRVALAAWPFAGGRAARRQSVRRKGRRSRTVSGLGRNRDSFCLAHHHTIEPIYSECSKNDAFFSCVGSGQGNRVAAQEAL